MKKSVKFVIGLLVCIAVGVIVYKAVNRAPSSEMDRNMQAQAVLESGGCIMCHSENSDLPFYAGFPVIGSKITKDVQTGLKHEDLTVTFASLKDGEPIPEVSLAKIEKVVLDGTMPKPEYYLIHWGASLTDAKKEILMSWVKEQRLDNYLAQLEDKALAENLAGESVRPIMDTISVDIRKAALGYKLFHDPRLSADNTVSCASCHGLNTGGVDNKQYSEGVNGSLGGVNAPTVYNAVYNFVQFWDGRAGTLADQAAGPPLNPVEMASLSFDEIIAKLKADKLFTKEFQAVYPEGYSEASITDAIQEFEKQLVTLNCRFDQYLKGDKTAITADEQTGYEKFKENKCATCHVGINLGGQSYEFMGLMHDYFADRGAELTEEDNGRYKQTKHERDRHRFKVPGLRNVELTQPYFHDGSQKTLEDAVREMGKYQIGINMIDADIAQIVAFLKTLTGEIPAAANVKTSL